MKMRIIDCYTVFHFPGIAHIHPKLFIAFENDQVARLARLDVLRLDFVTEEFFNIVITAGNRRIEPGSQAP